MGNKAEMALGEWFVRVFCKLVALGAAILGIGGFMIVGIRTILPLMNDARYVEASCAGIACVAVLYGLAPLALAVERALVNVSGTLRLTGQEGSSGTDE